MQAGCSIEEIKKAAKRTGDAAKDWIAGSNSHASQAMRVASENAEQVYESAKRALDETQTIGKERAEKYVAAGRNICSVGSGDVMHSAWELPAYTLPSG